MVKITSSAVFESNQTYFYDGEIIDFYPDKTPLVDCRPYYCSPAAKSDELPVAFYLKNLENITLDFGGATLIFHGRIIPFIFDGCRNIVLKNLKVDYARPFYTQAQVLSANPDEIKICMDEGFDYRVEDGFLYAVADTWERKLNTGDCLLWLYDRTGEKNYPITLGLFGPEIFPHKNPPMPVIRISVEEKEKVLTLKGPFPKEWRVEDDHHSLIFTHEPRDKNTVTFQSCKDVRVENFELIHGASMGIVCTDAENITMVNYSMHIGKRLVTNNADALHCYNCRGKVVMRDCYMDGHLDDTANVHNNYLILKEANGKRLMLECKCAGVNRRLPYFTAGERVAVYRGSTLDPRGEALLTGVSYDEKTGLYTFVTDRELEGPEAGDIVENLSAQPEILIENCRFGRFRGTMRLQSRGKTVVRSCRFENSEVPILFTGDTDYWYESGPIGEVLIENCYLNNMLLMDSHVTPTETHPFYHKHITVKNCHFTAPKVIKAMYLEKLTLENNTFEGGEPSLVLHHCGEVESDRKYIQERI